MSTATTDDHHDGSSTSHNNNVTENNNNRIILGYIFLFLSLLCLGTWPALLRLASSSSRKRKNQQQQQRRRRRRRRHRHQWCCFCCWNCCCDDRNCHDDVDDVNDVDTGDVMMTTTTTTTMTTHNSTTQQQQRRRTNNNNNNNRDERFVYLDYAFSYVISSLTPLIIILVLSSYNDNNNNTDDDNNDKDDNNNISYSENHHQEEILWNLIIVAMIGGGLLSIGNLSLQWAITVYGAPLTTIVAIQASLTVTVGTSINYMLQPYMTSSILWLCIGIVLFLLAIGTATLAHLLYGQSKEEYRDEKRRIRTMLRQQQQQQRRRIQQQQQRQQQHHEQDGITNEIVEIFMDEGNVDDDDDDDDDDSSFSSDDDDDDEYDDNNYANVGGGVYRPASPTTGIELKTKKRNGVSYNSLEEDMTDAPNNNINKTSPIVDMGTGSSDDRCPIHRIRYTDDGTGNNNNEVDHTGDHEPDSSRAALAEFRRSGRSRLVSDNRRGLTSTQKALVLAVGGGCCFGFFSPAFNVAVNDPFGFYASSSSSSSSSSGLTVPMANLWFSLAFTVTSVLGNVILMYVPPRESGLAPTTVKEYIRAPLFPDRSLGIFAGWLCGMANLLQFQGGQLIGFATADLVQAFPLVSTLWDIFLFGEYQRPRRTTVDTGLNSSSLIASSSSSTSSRYKVVTAYLVGMYILYLGAIACMMASAAV